LRNIKLIVAYNGLDFHGWQIQPGYRTVQAVLSAAVTDLVYGRGAWETAEKTPPKTRRRIIVHGASRTDAGVSALGQVCLFQLDSSRPIPVGNIPAAINHRLDRDVAVLEAEQVRAGFDLIGEVARKLYRYTIFTGKTPPVFEPNCWHLGRQPDVGAMAAAASLLVGRRNFKSFAAAADRRTSMTRTLFDCKVTAAGDRVCVDLEADGFLYNMARNIVGTLVDVGLGRLRADGIPRILEAEDRSAAGGIAPAGGLCLMWIRY
jgi:tRNA pseudouridine38-40 synthase